MIVVDASAVVDLLLRTPAAQALESLLFEPLQTLHAPSLIDIEFTHVIRRQVLNGELNAERGQSAVNNLLDLRMQRYPHGFLLPRVWALRSNLTAYDAVYVALAEALDATLLTRDCRLAKAAGHQARITLV